MPKDVRAITYRLYPKKSQEITMNHFLDCCRKVYNRLVEICKSYKEHHLPIPSEFDLNRMVTKIRKRNVWTQDIHSGCLYSVSKRVHNAFVRWMMGYKEGTGFPRFKSWKRFDSFTYKSGDSFSFVGKNGEKNQRERIRLGKIGLIKYRNPFVIKGKCKTATIYRRKIGNHFEWFASIAYENEDYRKDSLFIDPPINRIDIGLDLGLDNLAVLSNGIVIPNDHTYKKKEKTFSKIHNKISNCEKNTIGYQKQLTKLSHLYKKLRNYRNDMYHKITRNLSEKYSNIYMEDLSIQEMTEESFKGMKKSYRDASWGIFTKMICYKAAEAGNKVVFVNPAYTSQLCSSCGTMVPKDLSVREHVCPNCGLTITRDENAAINILNRGLGLQTVTGQCLKSHEG